MSSYVFDYITKMNIFNDDPHSNLFNMPLENCNNVNFNNIIANPNNFFIIQQNIRSMRKNFDIFLLNLNSFKCKPDFIFLTETWIYEEETSLYSIPGYTFKQIAIISTQQEGLLSLPKMNIFVNSHHIVLPVLIC